jgi:NAD kinase
MIPSGSRNSAWAAFDGRNRQEITQGKVVHIRASQWPVCTVNDNKVRL